jgi:hypothetical protein
VLALAASAPDHARAQPWGGEVAAASALTGLDAGLGTWVLSMPWSGFWSSAPEPDDGWSIVGGLVVAGLVSTGTVLVARGHPERAELMAAISGGGLALSSGIALFGGLVALLSDYDRLAFSLVFGVPVLASALFSLVAGLVHLAVEGDATVTPLPLLSPLAARF